VILQEPFHSVRRAALFVGGERENDVAIRYEPLLLQSNESVTMMASLAFMSCVPRP